jgi:penicillin-binding protein 1A
MVDSKKRNRARQKVEPQLFSGRAKAGNRGDASARTPVRRRRRSLLWSLVRFSFVMAFFGALGLTAVFGYIWFTLNQQGLLKIPERDPGIIILASDGSVLAEKGSFNGDEVRLAELPDYVPNAVIAIEDRRFYSHMGVDPIGLLRAA